MTTRKLKFQTFLDLQLSISSEMDSSLQPHEYKWIPSPGSTSQLTYDINNPDLYKELLKLERHEQSIVLAISSNALLSEVIINNVSQLESRTVSNLTANKSKELDSRELIVQNTLQETIVIGLEPYGYYVDVPSGAIAETTYNITQSPSLKSEPDLIEIEKKNGEISITIWSSDHLDEFSVDGERYH